jgi:RNA ligase
MAYLNDIAPLSLWSEMVREGYVRVQTHPKLPLVIYDYSEIAQYDRKWNAVTLASRGLIVNAHTGEIVSRVLTKFFNYGEPEIDTLNLTGDIVVSDKLDGSAGYSYPMPDGTLQIATRGSFASDQAIHASKVLSERYTGMWQPVSGRTYLWEIIYPQNRIVVSYDFDDIVLLAAIDNETGISIPASEVVEWRWKKSEQFPYTTLTEALEAPPRENAEGFVIHFRESDLRLKIKQADYVSLHKIVTGLNKRRVWEVLSSGNDFTSWVAGLPDEFTSDINAMKDEILDDFNALIKSIDSSYKELISKLSPDFTQKDFALLVNSEYKLLSGFLFAKLSGSQQKIDQKIWRTIEPAFEKPTWSFGGKRKVE